ncbi:hypothetical protein J1779_07920 [Rahnella sp. FC061912-K]|uniref:hypothetical protein n=1 Tax=Rahnella rivi TaxID=2816249 RepID=UPI001C263F29|nr:hypothetical protein [Rahnella rivi]MBU9829857.1 hypothetical protein [Rahnella rivi]
MKVKFIYKDGTSEEIDSVLANSVVMDENGSGAFLLHGDLTYYHFKDLKEFTVLEEVKP